MTKIFIALTLIFLLGACGTLPPLKTPFRPPTGIIYTNYKAPLSVEFNNNSPLQRNVEVPITYGAYYIFSIGVGDASLKNALKVGVLKNASYADYEWVSVLGMFYKLKLNIYGANGEY